MKTLTKKCIAFCILISAQSACLPVVADDHVLPPLELGPFSAGAFVDSYYAVDLNNPGTQTRAYTTQAFYDDEPNLNLAYGDVRLESDNIRGRVAIQGGTSVKANYAAEPHDGWRYIQEAYLGYQLTKDLWLDGGVFLSHLGPESWISRDNYTYTRSLISEYSPYYQSGVRLVYQATDELLAGVHLVRGWQNISDDRDAALGTQLSYQLTPALSLSYNTFVGDENGTRILNDFIVKAVLSEQLSSFAAVDVGYQNESEKNYSWWHGWAVVAQYKPWRKVAFAGRIERFLDPQGVVATTVTGEHFSITGFSLNADFALIPGLLWRTEYKVYLSGGDIFPDEHDAKDSSQLIVTSLSFSL